MTDELISEVTATPLIKVGSKTTTSITDTSAKEIKIDKKAVRRAQNAEYLKNENVSAFLKAIALAEGGGYDFKFGSVKGKKNDPWRFSDYSTHPGAGRGGTITAAGMYQINRETWKEMGEKMGLSDFSPQTQDLIAVEIFRSIKIIQSIVDGDVDTALPKASHRWSSLPQGKNLPGRYPKQHYVDYNDFINLYKENGGETK